MPVLADGQLSVDTQEHDMLVLGDTGAGALSKVIVLPCQAHVYLYKTRSADIQYCARGSFQRNILTRTFFRNENNVRPFTDKRAITLGNEQNGCKI